MTTTLDTLNAEPRTIFEAEEQSLNIYQVDTTNHCNATCTYCPQPTHERAKGFMALTTFDRVLKVMKNDTLSLHHFGEPLLNKALEQFVVRAKKANKVVGFSTNGKTLTQARLNKLREVGLDYLRLHTDPFGVRLKDFECPEGLEFTEHRLLVRSDAPKKEMVSYAGYLDIPQPAQRKCSYLADKWRVVLWDGDLALCCCDVEGLRTKKESNPLDLCKSCSGFVFKSPRDFGDYDGDGKNKLDQVR